MLTLGVNATAIGRATPVTHPSATSLAGTADGGPGVMPAGVA